MTQSSLRTFSCVCGSVRGETDLAGSISVACYCNDCADFLNWMASRSKCNLASKRQLFCDQSGGVHNLICYKNHVRIVQGIEHVRQIRFRAGSKLRRIVADCCGTPLINSVVTLPIAVVSTFNVEPNADGSSAVPAIDYRIHGSSAASRATPTPDAASQIGFQMGARLALMLLFSWGKTSPAPIDFKTCPMLPGPEASEPNAEAERAPVAAPNDEADEAERSLKSADDSTAKLQDDAEGGKRVGPDKNAQLNEVDRVNRV